MSQGNKYTKPEGNNTAKHEASEDALRQAEEKYRNIFENSLDGIFQSTSGGRFLTVNPALARMWGYESPEDLISSITDIARQVYVKPEQREEFMRLMEEYGKVEAFEFQAYRKDGTMIWVQENVRTVKDADGNLQYYEGTVKDITEQKQTLDALRRSEERSRRTLNNMLEGCQIIDFDWRYIYINDAAALHGRRKPEELLMRTMMEVYPDIENTELFRVLRHCMEARVHQRLENEFVFPDGDKGWFELSIEPVPEGLFILSIDITERKQAESDLRDREIRYRTLFENLPIPVFTKDREGRYTSFNAEESKYWVESPIGHTDHELLPPEIADGLRADDLRVMETGEPWSGEEMFPSPLGLMHSLVRKVPLYDGAGNVIGILGASLDITERKAFELALQESEEHFRSLYENAAIGIYRTDPDGRILMANPAAVRMLGYETLDELEQRNLEQEGYEPSYSRRKFREQIEETDVITGLESAWTQKDGSIIYVRESARAIRDKHGNIKYYDGTFEDITVQKWAEQALRASEVRFSIVFHASPVSIVLTRLKDNLVIDVNDAALKLTGLSGDEVVGHTLTELNIWGSPADSAKLIKKIKKLGRVEGFEYQMRKATGEIVDALLFAETIELSGEPHVLSMSLDISDRKQAEKKLREAEQFAQSTIDALTAHICVLDENSVVLSVNRAWHDFAEANPPVPPNHFIGANYLATCDAALGKNADEAALFAAGLRSVMENEREHFSLEYPCNVPGGEKRWFVAHVTRFTIDEVVRIVIAHENISKRKMVEEALDASNSRFSTAFNASPLATSITRMKDNLLIDVNQTMLELTGFSSEEALGHTALELNIWPNPDERGKLVEQLQQQGRVQGFEIQLRKKSGKIVDLLVSAEVIELSNEAHMLSMSMDISDRKRADRELRESEKRYRDLVDNSQELICTHDLDGNILSVNPWASKTLGYTSEELLKKNIMDFLLPGHRSGAQKYLAEIKKSGRLQGQLNVQTRSGEQLVWEFNNSLRTEGVEEPIVRGMAHDITEQRRAEKKIKQQLAHLTALNEIDRVIASSFDLDLTLNLLLRHVVRQLELDAAVILLANPSTNMLEYIAGEGFLGSKTKELKLRIGEDYAGKVALDRRTIHVPDLMTAEPPFSQPHLITDEKFVAYYGLPLIAKGQLKGVLEVFQRAPLDANDDWLSFLETLAEQAAIAIDNAQLFSTLQKTNADLSLAYDATIEGWSYALDLRDKETEGHTQRVTEITTKLCKKFGLSEKELTYARWGALLHDIGKMGVPDAILQKPGKLSDEEWVIMKMHTVYARNMLERINYLKSAIDIPYCHHEKWDGSGYPSGLKGEQIPLTARIFAITDVWDALTSDRPYRPAWSKSDTLDHIKSGAGTHFDPQVVKVFLESEELWKDTDE